MLLRLLKNAFARPAPEPPPSSMKEVLARSRGVVHVGASVGQECKVYASYGLSVLWIEPLPDIYAALLENIRPYPKQRALKYLVTDRTGAEYPFHVANNYGMSSSIFDLAKACDIWPWLKYEDTITLTSVTFDWLVEHEGVDLALYDTLIMDTQGSELLVLKGAERSLNAFHSVYTEAADFEAYAGCCRLEEIDAFLTQRGLTERARWKQADHPAGGAYYDVLFQRRR
jgi:FkbM family methyltransferase